MDSNQDTAVNHEQAKVYQILAKNLPLLESQQFYEYEQKITSQGFRFSSTNKVQSAISLYFVASKELLKRSQINSGFGLANRIIDLIPKGSIDQQTQDQFLSLYSVAPFGQAKVQFINKVLQKFAQDLKTKEHICHSVGVDLINNEKFHLAWRYLVYVENIDTQKVLLQKTIESTPQQDQELVAVRYILMKLIVSDLDSASKILKGLNIVKNTPLMNFLNLLLTVIKLRSQKAYEELYKQYAPIYAVDPLFKQLLSNIGGKYFNLAEQTQQSSGGLGGLFSQFFQS